VIGYTGRADDSGDDIGQAQARPADSHLCGLAHGAHQRGRGPGPVPLVEPGHHGAGQVRDGDPDEAATEVDAQHMPGRGIDLVDDGRAARAGDRPAGGADQPVLLQVEQGLPDGRLGQTGVRGDLRPRRRALATKPLQHESGDLVLGSGG
jgi:hypothetical protein